MRSAHNRNSPVRVPSVVLVEVYCGGAGTRREMAVGALVVATAIRLGGGVVLTDDPDGLRLLAARHRNVAVAAI